ncbi:MAG: hypothetical protein HC836_12740 [Richelia sp. RM2_1_2]|nr:hypothetical protein [Richelia sp. RM2_1_2]
MLVEKSVNNGVISGYNKNFSIIQGDNFYYNFNVLNNNGEPANLSGFSGFAVLKSSYGATGIIANFNFLIIGDTTGYCQINLPHITGIPVTKALYEVEITGDNAYHKKCLYGNFYIQPEL